MIVDWQNIQEQALNIVHPSIYTISIGVPSNTVQDVWKIAERSTDWVQVERGTAWIMPAAY